MARLDRLAPAQGGGAGRRRDRPGVLATSCSRPWRSGTRPSWTTALDQLVGAGLVFRRGAPPEATYLFKHALVQDAAYGTLLRGRRQELHGRIAQVLEERSPETADTQPELPRPTLRAGGLGGASG